MSNGRIGGVRGEDGEGETGVELVGGVAEKLGLPRRGRRIRDESTNVGDGGSNGTGKSGSVVGREGGAGDTMHVITLKANRVWLGADAIGAVEDTVERSRSGFGGAEVGVLLPWGAETTLSAAAHGSSGGCEDLVNGRVVPYESVGVVSGPIGFIVAAA